MDNYNATWSKKERSIQNYNNKTQISGKKTTTLNTKRYVSQQHFLLRRVMSLVEILC